MDVKKVALIVDDLPEARDQIRLDVEALGHDAVDASTFDEAREWLNDNRPDYVVLDLQIPMREGTPAEIKYGMTLLDEIVAKHPRTAIVVVTAHGKTFRYSTVVMHKSPFVTFVPKPFVDDDPENPSLMDGIKVVLAKVDEALPDNGSAKPKSVLPQVEVPRGTIDVRLIRKKGNIQFVCTVNGEERAFSKQEHRILKVFAKVQAAHCDDPHRHSAAADATEFGVDPKKFNALDTALYRLRKRLLDYLPEDHPPVIEHLDYQRYGLGCYCIDSTPQK